MLAPSTDVSRQGGAGTMTMSLATAGNQQALPEPQLRDALALLAAMWGPDAELVFAWSDGGTPRYCRFPSDSDDEAGLGPLIRRALKGQPAVEGYPLWHHWPTPAGGAALFGRAAAELEPPQRQLLLDTARMLLLTLVRSIDQQARIAGLESAKRLQNALYEIADLAGGEHELGQLLAHFHRIVGSLIYAENCYIVAYDHGQQTVRFLYFADRSHQFHPDPLREYRSSELPNSLTFPLLRHGAPISGPSVELFRRFGLEKQGMQMLGPEAVDWLGIPMKRGGQVCGAIVVQSYEPGVHYGDEERALLDFVAKHILTAMDRHAAHADLERRVAERTQDLRQLNTELEAEVAERRRAERLQAALFRIAELAMACRSQDQFYRQVHAVVVTLLDARNFYIALLDESGQRLDFVYSVDERVAERRSRPLGNGLTEHVLREGRALLLDARTLERMLAAGEFVEHGVKCHCWLGVPLFRDDNVVGAIVVQSYTEEVAFSEVDQRLLAFVGHNIGVSLTRQRDQDQLRLAHARLEERVEQRTAELGKVNEQLRLQINERLRVEDRLRHLAMHDVLTGLPNRLQLLEQMQACIEQARAGSCGPFALFFLDLDRFKLVNDSMGHAIGDQLLVEVARRLGVTLGEGDIVARLGGDEFAVLVRDGRDPEQLHVLARHLLGVVGQSLRLGGRELFPSASIGIAVWQAHYDSAEEMLRDADAAMYRAKGQTHERCLMFDAAMSEQALHSLELEADLRRAILKREFMPYYQPVVSLADGQVVGHEALLRWNHESRGVLSPGAFLAVAEESGLIEQVDWLMYEAVIAGLARGGNGYVSINVSPRHIRSPHFLSRLLGMIERYGADPRRLRVEITEVALLDDDARTMDCIRVLSGQGIQVQLDDFGTGYSALSYLHRFPIATLKIDRSFIAGLHAEDGNGTLVLVQGILSLARTLGIDTIAEGIETQRQLETLRAMRCNFGQGYLLGRPGPQAPHAAPAGGVRGDQRSAARRFSSNHLPASPGV